MARDHVAVHHIVHCAAARCGALLRQDPVDVAEIGLLSVTCLLLPGAAQAQSDEGRAKAILTAMRADLTAAPSLPFDADASFKIVTTDDRKPAIASSASVALLRPDKLRVVRHGGFDTVQLVRPCRPSAKKDLSMFKVKFRAVLTG